MHFSECSRIIKWHVYFAKYYILLRIICFLSMLLHSLHIHMQLCVWTCMFMYGWVYTCHSTCMEIRRQFLWGQFSPSTLFKMVSYCLHTLPSPQASGFWFYLPACHKSVEVTDMWHSVWLYPSCPASTLTTEPCPKANTTTFLHIAIKHQRQLLLPVSKTHYNSTDLWGGAV